MKVRVLIVEDNALVAIDLGQAFEAAGFEVAGISSSVAQGLALIRQRGCDAAVVDINLRGETSEPLADELRARGIPFLTVTGYARAQQSSAFEGTPTFTKPVAPQLIVAELKRHLGTVASD